MRRALQTSAYIMMMVAPAAATPADDQAAFEQNAQFQAIMDTAMAQMMRPGPKREGWSKGGADLYAMAQTAPGGSGQNYILSVDKDGDRTLTISGAAEADRFVPAGWEPVYRAGSGVNGAEVTDVTFGHLDGDSYFTGVQARKRIGDAFCSTGGMDGVLFRDPKRSTATALPKGAVEALFAMMVNRLEKHTICWRYDRDGDSYRVSHFLEDGQSLPALDEAGYRVRLVPAGPVEQLLGATASQ